MVNFEVNNGNEAEVPSQEETGFAADAAAEETPLISLKNRRTEIVNEMYIDLQVPRWTEPEMYVRFKPISAVKLSNAIDRRRKQKSDDWSLLANADMLVDACIGVYAKVDGFDRKLSLRHDDHDGEWTKFDPDLAKALGVEADRAVDVCRALYLTEGDLIDTANRVFRWSGIANEEADEAF
jgi:hypothetical protein